MAERFLTFRVDGELYALPANEVAEIIRLPAVARVPQAPKGLLGLANLRGSVLPVASARGKSPTAPSDSSMMRGGRSGQARKSFSASSFKA